MCVFDLLKKKPKSTLFTVYSKQVQCLNYILERTYWNNIYRPTVRYLHRRLIVHSVVQLECKDFNECKT